MQIERLTSKDYDEALDLINMVFSMAHCPFDFLRFLPRLYKPTDECMKWNLVVRDNGKIRALVGAYPDVVQAGGSTLKLAGIGAVSSHPNDRGKGWMKLLMDQQIEQMQREDADLSFLIGQRQRYMHFGYDKTGVMLEYKLNKSNLKGENGSDGLPKVRLEPLGAHDMLRINKAKELHDAQPVHCLRTTGDFYEYLVTGYMQPWAAIGPNDSMVGYLVSNTEKNRITEFFADDETAMAGIVHAWFAQQNVRETTIILPSWAQNSAWYLGGIAEEARVTDSGNWRILNWHRVVDALLQVKSGQCQLADGELCIGIKEYGNLKISVCGEKANCDKTTEPADIQWDALTATRIVFCNIPAASVSAIPQSIRPLISSWFPLPLSWLPQNYV